MLLRSTKKAEILHYERQLDLQHGILSRSIRWRSPIGNTVDLRFDRFASLADREVLGLRCQITPIDFDGTIEIQSSMNGYPDSQGFDHWEQIDLGKIDRGIWLQLRTRSSQIELGMAAKMTAMSIYAPWQTRINPRLESLRRLNQFLLFPIEICYIGG